MANFDDLNTRPDRTLYSEKDRPTRLPSFVIASITDSIQRHVNEFGNNIAKPTIDDNESLLSFPPRNRLDVFRFAPSGCHSIPLEGILDDYRAHRQRYSVRVREEQLVKEELWRKRKAGEEDVQNIKAERLACELLIRSIEIGKKRDQKNIISDTSKDLAARRASGANQAMMRAYEERAEEVQHRLLAATDQMYDSRLAAKQMELNVIMGKLKLAQDTLSIHNENTLDFQRKAETLTVRVLDGYSYAFAMAKEQKPQPQQDMDLRSTSVPPLFAPSKLKGSKGPTTPEKLPDWFHFFDTRGAYNIRGPNTRLRYFRLLSTVHSYHYHGCRDGNKTDPCAAAFPAFQPKLNYHEPYAGWSTELRRTKGGWWVCDCDATANSAFKPVCTQFVGELSDEQQADSPIHCSSAVARAKLDQITVEISRAMRAIVEQDRTNSLVSLYIGR
jgi:hypothetical protein